jgi:ferric-dicitrate binding protein FerR (iron transport regulator)
MQEDSQPRTAHRSRGLDPVLSEALEWFMRLREREVSEATRAAFEAWESASAEHARAEVAVRQGRVLYTAAAGLDAPVALGGGEGIAQDRSRIMPPRPIDARERFAWFEGRLIFRDRPLAEVLAEVERCLPGKILLMSSRLAATRVTGNYKLGDPLTIVRSLAETTNATVASATPYLVLLH